MIVYPVNDEERELLLSANVPNICWAACWYNECNSCAIEQDTLDMPEFAEHARIFATFPPRDGLEITISEDFPGFPEPPLTTDPWCPIVLR